MDAMKGEPRSILFVDNPEGRVQLVAFDDDSWGIVRCGKTVCTWEADELTDCLRTFLDMAGRCRRAGAERLDAPSHDAALRDTLAIRGLRALHSEPLN